MITFHKTIGGVLKTIHKPEKGCWISVEAPTEKEIDFLINKIGISKEFILTSLDENERSHVETDEDSYLIVFDVPMEVEPYRENVPGFSTIPVGFISMKNYIVSIISILSSPIIEEFSASDIHSLDSSNHAHFIFSAIYLASRHFITHLDRIDRMAFSIEQKMHKSMKNQELIQLQSLQKSLVYFTTSLNSSEATVQKLLRGKIIPITDEDEDLLEDILIEVKQSVETAGIYTGVLSSTSDAVASIISNNMNLVMKVLTSLTMVLSIPNMVFGFYGMNVAFHSPNITYLLPISITISIVSVVAFILYKNDFF